MKTTNQNNNTEEQIANQAVGSNRRPMILLGQDVHAASVTVEVQCEGCVPQPPQRIATEKYVSWVRQLQAKHPEAMVHAVYEAGPCGYWLHRELERLGVQSRVVAPVALNGRRKCDKRDAGALRRQLSAYLSGDTRAFSVVHVPSTEQEQDRALLRHRSSLGRSLRRAAAQGRSLLLLQGLRVKGTWWGKHRWPALRETLPEWLRELLADFQTHAQLLHAQIKAVEVKLATLAKKKNLHAPYGLGVLTLLTLLLEVGEWHRFHNRRQVGSYFGLCGGEWSSGESRREGSIDKRGNPRLRHAVQEAVWRLLRWQPGYKPLQRILVAKGSRERRRAAVAAARRLAVDLWRLATGQTTTAKLGFTANA